MLEKLTDSKLISETVRLVKAERRLQDLARDSRGIKTKLAGDLAQDPRNRGFDHIGQDIGEIYFGLLASPRSSNHAY